MSKKVYINRRARFNAAHKLWNPLWDEQKNQEIFGKCSNHNWHGHNYELHVTVKGTPHVDTGYCMDMKELSDIIKEFVEEPLDHKNLNLDVPWMHGKLASTENLVIEIWNQLIDPVSKHNCVLHAIRLYETENNYVDYYGGE